VKTQTAIVTLGLLAGCGPVSLQQAERECFDRARVAEQPRGTIGVGIGSGGNLRTQGDITISSDYILGRGPSAVYEACVMQRSGQAPSRPYYSYPERRG
jgi:hypothetical protein